MGAGKAVAGIAVAPFMGAWIETKIRPRDITAWIETSVKVIRFNALVEPYLTFMGCAWN